MKRFVILENIRSAHNVGAIFRTADGAGVTKIFLVGYTPTPVDRFGRDQAEILKTSLGASKHMTWEHYDSIALLIPTLVANNIHIIAVEQTNHSVPYTEIKSAENQAYIFGNEIDGVSNEALAAAEVVIDIPMSGHKESLNVATTAGIILFNARDSH